MASSAYDIFLMYRDLFAIVIMITYELRRVLYDNLLHDRVKFAEEDRCYFMCPENVRGLLHLQEFR